MGVHFRSLSLGICIAATGVLGFAVPKIAEMTSSNVEGLTNYSTFGALLTIWLGMTLFIVQALRSGDRRKAYDGWVHVAGVSVALAGLGVVSVAGMTAIEGDAFLSPGVTIYAAIGFGALITLIGVFYSFKRCMAKQQGIPIDGLAQAPRMIGGMGE